MSSLIAITDRYVHQTPFLGIKPWIPYSVAKTTAVALASLTGIGFVVYRFVPRSFWFSMDYKLKTLLEKEPTDGESLSDSKSGKAGEFFLFKRLTQHCVEYIVYPNQNDDNVAATYKLSIHDLPGRIFILENCIESDDPDAHQRVIYNRDGSYKVIFPDFITNFESPENLEKQKKCFQLLADQYINRIFCLLYSANKRRVSY